MSTVHTAQPTADAFHMPPVLPVVTMTIAADGTMSVTVDGRAFEPPQFGPSWVRSSFATVIDSVMEERGSPVRVLVHETDGTIFTDIVTRPLQRALDPTANQPRRKGSPVDPTNRDDALIDAGPLIEPPRVAVGEDGFIPGEEVAVAVIVRHTKASAGGSARALLEPGLLQIGGPDEVVLIGRISGTCVIGDLT